MADPTHQPVLSPAGYVTQQVIAALDTEGLSVPIDAANPLPVAIGGRAAIAAPLAGVASVSATVGPFVPDLGRAVWLTLSGVWSGTVQVLRSIDAGATRLPLTAAGQPFGVFSANANEPVAEESVAGATYYLQVALTAGALTYRVQQ